MAATGCHRSAQVTDVMSSAVSVAETVLVCIYSGPRLRVSLHIILHLLLRTGLGGVPFFHISWGLRLPASNSCIYIIVLYIFFFFIFMTSPWRVCHLAPLRHDQLYNLTSCLDPPKRNHAFGQAPIDHAILYRYLLEVQNRPYNQCLNVLNN